MKTLQIAWIALLLAGLGCRSSNNQVLLERDLRIQEDKIYELEAMLDDVCAAREATLRENEALKRELGGDRAPSSDYRSPPDSSPRSAPPRSRPEVPKLELPKVDVPEIEGGPAPLDAPGVETTPGKTDEAIVEGQPTQLVINSRLTGGLDRDGRRGDEGVLVAFEPRDEAGRLVNGKGGAVSVVVLDPSLEGEAGRVARWDFKPEEVPGHFHVTPFGRGLQFELPWPAQPPKHQSLRLYVRYTTPDGKKITADTPLEVRGPSSVAEFERQGEAWSNGSQSESAERPARPAEPKSRLKQRGASGRDRTAAVDDRDADDEEGDDAGSDSRQREPIRQATRPDRPTWKPYR